MIVRFLKSFIKGHRLARFQRRISSLWDQPFDNDYLKRLHSVNKDEEEILEKYFYFTDMVLKGFLIFGEKF